MYVLNICTYIYVYIVKTPNYTGTKCVNALIKNMYD